MKWTSIQNQRAKRDDAGSDKRLRWLSADGFGAHHARPTRLDRVLAVNAIGTLIILGIALHGFIMERPEFVDIALLYAILNFIGTFAVLKLFSTGSLGDAASSRKK